MRKLCATIGAAVALAGVGLVTHSATSDAPTAPTAAAACSGAGYNNCPALRLPDDVSDIELRVIASPVPGIR